MRIPALPVLLLIALALGACKHIPSEEEQRIATSRRAIAVDHLNNGRHRQALSELLEAEKLNPDDPELQYTMGLVYLTGFKRGDDARQHLGRALALKEKYSEAENLYGVSLMQEERYAEAVPYFERALTNLLYATPEFARQNLGWSLYKSGQVERGLRELEQAVQQAPNLCGGYYQLGVAHAEQGQAGLAVRWFQTFRERCDGTPLSSYVGPERLADVLYRLGMAQQQLGATADARAALEDCVERFAKTAAGAECAKSLALLP